MLVRGLKASVEAENEIVPIRTDFKVWLAVNECINSAEPTENKLATILGLVYPRLPKSFTGAVRAAMDFYTAGKDGGGGERSFDFSEDSELILAAFRQQYGIDLLRDGLHWHEFLALFSALGSETLFAKVVSVRTAELSAVSDKNKRQALARLKKLYALAPTEAEKRENDKIINSLKRNKGGADGGQ